MTNLTKKSLIWGCVLFLFIFGSSIFFRWATDTIIGSGEFNAYWAASRLLLEGRNPTDRGNLMEIQRTHFDPDRNYAMMVWNPPTTWVLMLPLAWMPFQTARVTWLLMNIVLVLTSCVMLYKVYFSTENTFALAISCLIAVFFSPVLVTIASGQVSLLILFGLAASLFFMKQGKWFWAGAMLIFTTPKPHLVLLAAPFLMLYMALHRKWSGWLGLWISGVVCIVVLFILRPDWMMDYSAHLKAPPIKWLTPTLGGILRSYGASTWTQYIGGLLLLALPFLLRQPPSLSLETTVSLLTLITIPTTFFGWSFDQSLLLVPIMQIIRWLFAPVGPRIGRFLISVMIVCVVIGGIAQRFISRSELDYFWISLMWAGIYTLAWRVAKVESSASPTTCSIAETP